MKVDDFKQILRPIALIKMPVASFDGQEKIYHFFFKDVSLGEFKDFCLWYVQSDEANEVKLRFPAPKTLYGKFCSWRAGREVDMTDNAFYDEKKRRWIKYDSQEYLDMCNTPGALKAKREFYDKLMGECSSRERGTEAKSGEMVKLLHCIGDAVVMGPYQAAKKWLKANPEEAEKEAVRARTIARAEQEAELV